MVEIVSIGVLSLQGAVSEQKGSIIRTFNEANIDGKVTLVREKKDINEIDALIIPGGESTTISRILLKSGIYEIILQRIEENNLPIMGTCAGCVLLAKEIVNNDNDIRLLHAVDMKVERNAFGRQKESFEKDIKIKGFAKPYNAVFIRAPIIRKVWGDCKILSKIGEKIIAARQEKFLALSFHPELTSDFRIHRYFLDMII